MASNETLWKIMYSGYGTRLCREQFYEIIEHCRQKNIQNKIGGYIVFNEKTLEVHQYLEGPRNNILETYDRIKRDPRISNITSFNSGRCERRFTRRDGLTPWRLSDGYKVESRNIPFYKLSSDEFHKTYKEVLTVLKIMTKIKEEEEWKQLEAMVSAPYLKTSSSQIQKPSRIMATPSLASKKGGLYKKKRKDTPVPWLAKTSSTHAADSRKKLLAAIETNNSQFAAKRRCIERTMGTQRGRPAAGEQKRRGERTKGFEQRARWPVSRRYGRTRAAKNNLRELSEQIAHDFKFYVGGSSKAATPTMKGILKNEGSGILKTKRKENHWQTTAETSDKLTGHKRERSSSQKQRGTLTKKSKRTARPLSYAIDSICVEKRRREKRRKKSAQKNADARIRKPSLNGVKPAALF